jgi:DNA-binding sugar fermentation-stimulating protein
MSQSEHVQPINFWCLQGMLHKRYKRFLADIEFPGSRNMQQASAAVSAAAAAAPTDSAEGRPAVPSPKRRRRPAATAGAAAGPQAAAATTAMAPAMDSSSTQQAAVSALTVVHCPNTGSMAGMLDVLPTPAACSVSDSATRKYKHTLEMICVPTQQLPGQQPEASSAAAAAAAAVSAAAGAAQPRSTWVGVHSALANKLAAAMLKQQLLPQLGQYSSVQPEVKLGGTSSTRVDFMLTRPDGRKVYVEVKSVTMAMTQQQWSSSKSGSLKDGSSGSSSRKRAAGGAKKSPGKQQPAAAALQQVDAVTAAAGPAATAPTGAGETSAVEAAAAGGLVAVFPDAVSVRAQRHAQDLAQLKAAGHDAVCLFVLQRDDCACFAPAAHIDPAYAAALQAAAVAGVQMLAVVCEQDAAAGAIWFRGCVPVVL